MVVATHFLGIDRTVSYSLLPLFFFFLLVVMLVVVVVLAVVASNQNSWREYYETLLLPSA